MFDIKIKTPKVALFYVYFKKNYEVAVAAKNNDKPMSVRLAHDVSEHTAKVDSKMTMKYLGYNITRRDMQHCSVCAEAKVRQKNLPTRAISIQVVKMEPPIPKEGNGKANLDIITIKAPKEVNVTVTKPQRRILADQRTQMKFGDFC